MEIQGLGYVGVPARDQSEWRRFAVDLLGMQPVGNGSARDPGALQLRIDDRYQRLTVVGGDTDGGGWYGWEVADAGALDRAVGELEAAGVAATSATAEELDVRRVQAMVSFVDPAGHRHELFHGADSGPPFEAPSERSGFRTGDLGMGHVVLMVPELEPEQRFFEEVLGFRVSDYMRAPFTASFLHTNRRHHSVALLEVGVTGLHHLMLEANEMDDIGRAYDTVERDGWRVARTLGRHTNDHMFSFYAFSPSGFEVEYGWGGRLVDDAWTPAELTEGPSFWGHTPTE